MLLPDVDVLLAGLRTDHVHHLLARAFLEQCRSATVVVGLSDVAMASVVRLSTNPRILKRPDTTDAVIQCLDVMLDPPAQLLRAGTAHWMGFTDLCRHLQLRGNLVPDAHLAATALEQGAERVTFDRGFGRYPRLRWRCRLDS